ncbi:MAG: cation transporter [Actinomycetia bacterium]|nr:cation transporter [Actinomycetes bacterium]
MSESGALRLGQWTMLLLAFLGFAAFYFSGAAALSVDSAYSLINFASAIVARKVMIASRSKPDVTHPYGKGALENTYVLIRSSIIVGVIGLAFVGAVVSLIDYFVYGDTTEIHLGIAGGYGVIAAVILLLLSLNYARTERIAPSGVLTAERKATHLDAIMSAATGITFIVIAFIPNGTVITSESFNIREIADSILVIVLVLLLISEPWRTIKAEFGRITGERQDRAIEARIRDLLSDQVESVTDIYAVNRGSLIEIDLRLSYSGAKSVSELDAIRMSIVTLLAQELGKIRVHVVFTNREISNMN